MPEIPPENQLAETRNLVVILRLVLNPRGELAYGEILDSQAHPVGRFVDWSSLSRQVRDWVEVRNEHG